MSNFPIIATVLSMVLGLSVTRLLLGALTVFRIRRAAAPDWVPLVWSITLFATQLDFWWAINSLPSVKATFTFSEFILLVLLALSLFLTAALLLPSRSEDEQNGLRIYFEQDGRYALLFLSTYYVLGLVVNIVFFQVSPVALWGLLDVLMIVLPLCAFFIKARKAYSGIALVFAAINFADIAVTITG